MADGAEQPEQQVFVYFDEDYLVGYDVSTEENRKLLVSAIVRGFLRVRAGRPAEPPDFIEADIEKMPASMQKEARRTLSAYEMGVKRQEEAKPVIERGQALIDAGDIEGMLAFLEEEDDTCISLRPGGRGDQSVIRVRAARPDQEIFLSNWR